MNTKTSLKIGALAASIALAMGSTAAMAATTAPSTTQLPGKGAILSGAGTVSAGTIASGEQTITITGNGVINWGSGSDINASGTGGFDIGSGAKLHFAGQTASGTDAVLNIDSSGNASQIFGALDAAGSLGTTDIFVANSNGVIVGAGATVNGNVSLIANKLATGATSAFATDPTTLAYNGTGGDVTVQKGASLNGTILVSGGGNVNVDLSALTGGNTTLSTGLSSANAGSFASSNANATLNVTGARGQGSLVGFDSAGTASNSGELDLGSTSVDVAGVLTNTGMLTLPANNGSVHNLGQMLAGGATFKGTLTNDGTFNAGGFINVIGGDLTNNGTINSANSISVSDGSITNKGALNGAGTIISSSDSSYTAGADYSIVNSGTISGTSNLYVSANSGEGHYVSASNDTTGSFTNTGTLALGAGRELDVYANNDVSLGGSVKAGTAAVSASNALSKFYLSADNGVLTVSTPLAFAPVGNYDALLSGQQVKLVADVTGVDASYEAFLQVRAGDEMASDYAIRVGTGVTVASHHTWFGGITADVNPNVILQGHAQGNDVEFGWSYGSGLAPVSDVFSGPQGGILATGASPYVEFDFTGKVKSAPYLNDSNFRYNYLPITVEGTDPVYIGFNPVAYQTNGTNNGLSAVNLLVNGGAIIDDYIGTPIAVTQSSAVTGVNNWANTHLVVQATGSIETGGEDGSFYWPGYVYLGNIAANADGSAAPGTLGLGSIVLDGNFNNVLPGDTSGAGGIHFITQYPLQMGSYTVTTNANSWINFGTDQLTAAYAAGVQGAGQFFGGVQGSGNVVNYGDLDPSLFQTQAPSSTK